MLSKLGTFKYKIESSFCDFTGRATLPGLSYFIIHAATVHAGERGFGYESIIEKNFSWVLSRISFHIFELPEYGKDIYIRTWVEGIRGFFSERCFNIEDSDKRKIGDVRTVWAAIDVNSRKPVNLIKVMPEMEAYVDHTFICETEKPSHIPVLQSVDPLMGYTVRYSDMDINRHMSSIRYMEHVLDVFDLEKFEKSCISHFEMVYLTEAHYGDKLKLHQSEPSPGSYLIDTKREDESICRSRVIWK